MSRSRLGLVSLANRLSKAGFGQVGDQVDQVKARARSLTIRTNMNKKRLLPEKFGIIHFINCVSHASIGIAAKINQGHYTIVCRLNALNQI